MPHRLVPARSNCSKRILNTPKTIKLLLFIFIFISLVFFSFFFPPSASVSEAAPASQSHPESFKAPPEPPAAPGTPENAAKNEAERDTCLEGETEEEKAKRLLYCSLCKVAVNSASQLQAHNSGERPQAPPPPLQVNPIPGWCVRRFYRLLTSLYVPRRHKAQDYVGGEERGRSHQVLPQDGGQGQVGGSIRDVDRAPEQNFPLRDLRCARQL